MSVSAAKSRVMQAKMQLESNRASDAEATVEQGLKFLEGLPDAETAAVRADLMAIKAAIASVPKPEDVRSVSAALGKIRQARSQIEGRQTSGIDDTLRAAEGYLASVPDAVKAAAVAEIAAVRAALSAMRPEAPRQQVAEVPRASGAADPSRAPVAAAAPAAVAARAPAPVAAAATAPVANPPPAARPTPPSFERASGAAPPRPPAAAPAATAPAHPAASPPPAAKPAPLSDDDHANLSRAKGRVNQARSLIETRRTENVAAILDEAMGFIDQLPAGAGAQLAADVAKLREQAAGTDAAEDTRRIDEELGRHSRSAAQDIEHGSFRGATASIERVEARVKDEDVRRILKPDAVAAYAAGAADLRKRLAARIKADALDRALPLANDLEACVADDPFAGKDQRAAYEATGAVETLKHRIRAALRPVPEGDADVQAIEARIVAVDAKVDAASIAWGKARLDAEVENGWSFVESAIAGWDAERVPEGERPFSSPDLPRTKLAIQRIKYLLADPATAKVREENKGDATIEGTYRKAEAIFEAAADKLGAAYAKVIEQGEPLEAPLNQFDLERPAHLAHDAEQTLAGTRHAESIAARARAVDARWKAEVAAIQKARQELLEKLSAEADVAWPAIAAATKAVKFDVNNLAPGTVVLLEDVYNRCGWDYGGRQWDFAVWMDEVVVAGVYEPHVVKAIEHACYEQKVGVTDRVTWNLVGVIVGPSRIGERTTVVLRDKFTNFEIGKLEEWPLIDCLKIKIIALHAGPVAVGPTPQARA